VKEHKHVNKSDPDRLQKPTRGIYFFPFPFAAGFFFPEVPFDSGLDPLPFLAIISA